MTMKPEDINNTQEAASLHLLDGQQAADRECPKCKGRGLVWNFLGLEQHQCEKKRFGRKKREDAVDEQLTAMVLKAIQ